MTSGDREAEFMDQLLRQAASRINDPRVTFMQIHHGNEADAPVGASPSAEPLPTMVWRRASELAEQITGLRAHLWLPGPPPAEGELTFRRVADGDATPVLTTTENLADAVAEQIESRLLVAGWRTDTADHQRIVATKDGQTLTLAFITHEATLELQGAPLDVGHLRHDELHRQLALIPSTIAIPGGI